MSFSKPVASMSVAAIVTLGLFVGSGGSPAFAQATQETPKDDYSVSLSFKLWANKWSTPLGGNANTGTFNASIDSERTNAFIPSVAIVYKKFFASLSIFVPDYKFRNVNANGQTIVIDDAGRDEEDLNFGYFVTPQVGLTVGLKHMRHEVDWHTANASGKQAVRETIPTIGAVGALPVYGGFFAYGNGAVGASNSYRSGEVGLGYRFFGNTLVTAGYKAQRLVVDQGCGGACVLKGKDSTDGFIAGIAYTF